MSSKTILLVEDNPQDEMLALRALSKVNLLNQVDVVRDGQQAIDYLFQQGEFAVLAGRPLPAVVLLDLSLPRLSGLDVLERLRAEPRTRFLPVAVLTSSDEEWDRAQSYMNGANSFVRKPLDFAEFIAAVQQVGIYWLALNEPSLL